jgi:hypothetical protein
MSRVAYDRVCKALGGTALAGQIEKLNSELHLTPESPEWVIAALAMIAGQGLSERVDRATADFQKSASAIPAAMREAGLEIVNGLAGDIAAATSAAITSEARDAYREELAAQVATLSEVFFRVDKQMHAIAKQAQDAVVRASGTPHRIEAEAIGLRAAGEHIKDALSGYMRAAYVMAALAIIGGAGAGAFGERYYAHQTCAANFAHSVGAYNKNYGAFVRRYCP